MAYTPNSVITQLFSFPDFALTYAISGAVSASDVGKAVTLDLTKTNTMKLAGSTDPIYGRLETLETGGLDGLTVGTVSRKFKAKLPKATGTVMAVGDCAVGDVTGLVKTGTPADHKNTVVEVGSDYVVVEKL